MKQKALLIAFEGLSLCEKIEIVNTSFKNRDLNTQTALIN